MEKIIPLKAKFLMDENPQAVILDVRSFEEYMADGHLKGAMLIPLDRLAERAGEDLPDRDVMIFVYCRRGARSSEAARLLDSMGYKCVYDIGGLVKWPFDIESQQ